MAVTYAGRSFLSQAWFVVITVMLSFSQAMAQTDLDDIHIVPRLQSAPSVVNSQTRDAAGVFRKAVDLVLVPVTVMDESSRIVTGLGPQNFRLYEDKRAQSIKHFWNEDGPVSVGIVLDVSGSMDTKINRAQDAVMALLKISNPQDEFFLTTFADRPVLVRDFTQNLDDIQSALLFLKPKGQTSLLDAIVLSLNNMKNARYQRKALVIISDGGDNRSRYTEREVKSLIKEADVLVYSIGVFDTEFRTVEERLGPELLADISGLTGASAYTVDNPKELPRITEHIAKELRNQYVLCYRPDSSRRDGKWRKIKVNLVLPHGFPGFHVQAKTGYYGAAE